MIESRCGLRCSDCNFRESMGCKGCVNMDKPFWADSCPVKSCCEKKGLQHCGECDGFVCPLLQTFAYDMEQSDNGARIEQCQNGVTIMASSKEYLHFILEQLSDLDDMPRPGGIRVGSSSSSSSGSSPPIISEHVISTSPISSGALPCMSGRSYTLCVSATCRSSHIALGERPTACPSPLRRAFLPPSLCCTAKAA